MGRMNRDAAVAVIDALDVRTDDKVLEVDFGPGVGIQILLQRTANGSVAGVDPSQEMVVQAAARNADGVRSRRADLRYGAAEHLPFANATFDKALAINSMQVRPAAGPGLREILGVLKPGGRVALGFTVNSGQAKEGMIELITAAGFADARIVEYPKLFYVLAGKP